MKTILSQLIGTDEFAALTPDELRNLVLQLDEQIMFSSDEAVNPHADNTQA